MSTRSLAITAVLAAFAPLASAQVALVTQERFVLATSSVTSGPEVDDSDEALNNGPYLHTANAAVTGVAGADAIGSAFQDTALTATLIRGSLSANTQAHTGVTFDVGEASGQSSILYIFSLAQDTAIVFTANGELAFIGQDPNGEPSDLYGISSVQLLDGVTEDPISGFQMNAGAPAGTDSAHVHRHPPRRSVCDSRQGPSLHLQRRPARPSPALRQWHRHHVLYAHRRQRRRPLRLGRLQLRRRRRH